MSIKSAASAVLQKYRSGFGPTITIDGVAGSCTTASDSDTPEFLPDGSRNAAWADNRVFAVSPAVAVTFPRVSVPQDLEGREAVLSLSGQTYVITSAYVTDLQTTWRIKAYRKPVEAESVTAVAQSSIFDQ